MSAPEERREAPQHWLFAGSVFLTLGACGSSGEDGNGSADESSASGGSGDRSEPSGGSEGDGDSGGDGDGDSGDGDGDSGDGDIGGDGDGDSGDGDGDTSPGLDLSCRAEGDSLTTMVFENRCAEELTFAGSDIPGRVLSPGASTCVDIGAATESLSAKRYWGWLGEDPGAEQHTLAEFTFNTDFNDFDWYNISHVDAHNLTMQIVPLDRDSCESLTCADSLLADCPEVGRVTDAEGALISCISPDRDDPNSPVVLYFESCEDGYAWSGDDQQGEDKSPVRACAGEDWLITFCP